MAAGNVTEQIAIIGKIAADGDYAGVAKARQDMVGVIARNEPFASVRLIVARVDVSIASMAALMPPELGTEALRMFHVEHPIFGNTIPDDISVGIDAAKKLNKEWLRRKQHEAETKKKLDQAASLGVVLPDGEEEVGTAQAASVLQAIRAKRARAGDPLAQAELEARGIEVAALVAAEALNGAAEDEDPDTDDDGPECSYCGMDYQDDGDGVCCHCGHEQTEAEDEEVPCGVCGLTKDDEGKCGCA